MKFPAGNWHIILNTFFMWYIQLWSSSHFTSDALGTLHLGSMGCSLGLQLSSFHILVSIQFPAQLRRYESCMVD